MAILSHKLQRVLKKALSFKKAKISGTYENLEIEKVEKKPSGRKGYVPIYVGEDDDPKMLYEVPMAAMKSPIFVAMLDQYLQDDDIMINGRCGPLSLPCSAVAFERVLKIIS